MARITPPNPRLVQGSGGISTSAPISGTGIARTTQALGKAVTAAGSQLANAADQAYKQAVYSKSLNQATKLFNDSYNERVNRIVDEKGQPTFSTLVEDTGKLGQDALNSSLENVSDPTVRARLTASFNGYVTNRQALANGTARKQQIDFTRSGLFEGIDGLKQQAFEDDVVNTNQYKSSISELVDSGLKTGALSPLEASKIKDSAFEEITVKHLRDTIQNDPNGALIALQSANPSDLGVSQGTHDKLIYQAQKSVNEQQKRQMLQEKEQERLLKDRQSLNAGELEIGILQSSVGQNEIQQAFDNGKINPNQRQSLLKKVIRRDVTERRSKKVGLDISRTMEAGQPLTLFSPSQISSHYEEQVASISQNGQQPTLQEKAKIASKYTAPVVSFSKEINYGLVSGSEEQAISAARAFQFASQRQPLSVETPSLSRDAKAIASTYLALTEGSKVSDSEAMRIARRQVLEKDDLEIQKRSKQAPKIDAFNKDLEKTIKNMFDTNKGFIDFPGGEADSVSPEVLQTYKRLFRTAYIETGDKDAAIEFVRSETAALYGPSQVNGPSSEIMFLPPEKLYPGITPNIIRQQIVSDSSSLDLPNGVSPSDIKISADELSRSNPNMITYGMYYEDQFGNRIPVRNSDGDLARFSVDQKSAQESSKASGLQEAIQKRQSIQETGAGTGQGPLGVSGRFISKFGKVSERRIQDAEVISEENEAELDQQEMDIHQLNVGKPEPTIDQKITNEVISSVINKRGAIVDNQQKDMFFNKYRQSFGGLKQKQIQPLENLMSKMIDDSRLTDQQKAYVLATVKHETADTFSPINEYGRGRGRSYGKPDPETGQTYFGRGYVQLTWKKNYKVMGDLIGVDLVNNPELANDPDIAYEILVVGMKEGLFTGVGLDKYVSDGKVDYTNARRIVNGTDRANLIAGYAKKFDSIINNTKLASN